MSQIGERGFSPQHLDSKKRQLCAAHIECTKWLSGNESEQLTSSGGTARYKRSRTRQRDRSKAFSFTNPITRDLTLGFLPMRISDVGRVCAFIMGTDGHLGALGHIDDLAGPGGYYASVAFDGYLAFENDHHVIDDDMFIDAHIGAIAAITYGDRAALALIGNIACINLKTSIPCWFLMFLIVITDVSPETAG